MGADSPGTTDVAALRAALTGRSRRVVDSDRQAAVLVPIITHADGPSLLLTRRTDTVGTHRGQVAFAGGRVDAEDADRIATAVREADEEIGLKRVDLTVLGLLDDVVAPTPRDDVIARGSTAVTPVVAMVRGRPTFVPSPYEVARIFTIPVAALQIAEGWRTQPVTWKGRVWPMYFFDYDGETLWGMSAYITLSLLSLLPGGAPFSPPNTDRRTT